MTSDIPTQPNKLAQLQKRKAPWTPSSLPISFSLCFRTKWPTLAHFEVPQELQPSVAMRCRLCSTNMGLPRQAAGSLATTFLFVLGTSRRILSERKMMFGKYMVKLCGRRGFRTCCNMPVLCLLLVNCLLAMETSRLWLWNLWFAPGVYRLWEVRFFHLGGWKCKLQMTMWDVSGCLFMGRTENPIYCLSSGIVVKKMVNFHGLWLILSKEVFSNDWGNLSFLKSQIQKSA